MAAPPAARVAVPPAAAVPARALGASSASPRPAVPVSRPQSLRPMVVVVGFLLFSVIVNDLADTAIDRVNLPTDRGGRSSPGWGRAGSCPDRGRAPPSSPSGGGVDRRAGARRRRRRAPAQRRLLVAAVPARRGGLAGAAGAVRRGAVPRRASPRSEPTCDRADLVLVAGLYLGFVGRILLKDFRDVAGDALYGKRTFLVRHGRRATCTFAAVGWLLGPLCLLGVRELTVALVAAEVVFVAAALLLLRALATDGGPRRDEPLISAIAIVGRGVVLCVIAHLGTVDEGWSVAATSAMTARWPSSSSARPRPCCATGP